jgi:transcriptional regulator with XRE-family HTH domain
MNENIYNAMFGARVRIYREKLGLTQKDLAEKLGYTSHASIAKIEKGENSIPLSKLPDFCIALNVQPFDLLGMTENDKKVWLIAEQMASKNNNADIQRFVEIYVKIMENSKNGVSNLD